LIVVLASLFTACGKFKCDGCGEEKSGKKYKREAQGETFVFCEECNDALEALKNAFS
jgi:hypothetical protein